MSILPISFYNQPANIVARLLLGQVLTRRFESGLTARGLIVETEAYLPENDPAAHSHIGLTPRNKSLFGPPGKIYVFQIHRYFCLNAVCQPEKVGTGVLIRAIEPLENIALPTNGPGRLCQALGINRSFDGLDFTTSTSPLTIHTLPFSQDFHISTSPRVGISKARDLPLRFFITDNPYVSRTTKLSQKVQRV